MNPILILLAASTLRQIQQEIPDQRLLPYGGPWGQRVPDVPAFHEELSAFDRNVPPAADILPTGGENRDVIERPLEILMDRAFRLKSSSSYDQTAMQRMMSILATGGSATDRSSLLGLIRNVLERRLQSVAITRGLLLSGMACGDFSWTHLGYVTGNLDFGMPSELKITPSEYWMENDGSANTDSTPISDLIALDQAARNLGGAAYTAIDMSQAMFNAMIASTEYQNQAKAISAVYNVASLPVAGSPAAQVLAELVIGKKIFIVDQTYQFENNDASRTTGRYVPDKYVILWHAEAAGQSVMWDFANCAIAESAVAAVLGVGAFGGDVVRGPVSYVTGDTNNLSYVRQNATQEGTPRRRVRTCTARILAKEPS